LELYSAGYRKLQTANASLLGLGEHVMPREVPIDNAGEASGGGQQAGAEQSQWQRYALHLFRLPSLPILVFFNHTLLIPQ
jgi:hypothetical protein